MGFILFEPGKNYQNFGKKMCISNLFLRLILVTKNPAKDVRFSYSNFALGAVHKVRHLFFEIFDPSLPHVTQGHFLMTPPIK